jgi:translocation and assembly module TamB
MASDKTLRDAGHAGKARRIIRRLLIAIPWLIALVVVIGLIAINTSAFRNFMRSEIVRQAADQLGARVEVGAIETHWTHLGVAVNNIIVYGDTHPGPNEQPLLQAQRLEVGVRFWPLLRGKVQLRELIVDQPVMHLRIDSQGRSNLPKPPHPSTSREPDTIFNLEIADCEIRSGQIYYNDAQTPLDAELHDVKFVTGYGLLSGQYKGSLSYDNARIKSATLAPLNHSLQMQFAADRAGLTVDSLAVQTPASRIALRARLNNYQSPSIAGSYDANISTSEVANAFRLENIPVGVVALKGSLGYDSSDKRAFLAAVNLQGQVSSDRLQIRGAQQPIDATSVSATFAMKDATLAVNNLVARILGAQARANWQMSHMDAAKSSQRLDASLQGISLQTASAAFAPRNVQRIHLSGASDLDVQAAWTGRVSDAVAHARLAVKSAQQGISSQMIPVNGLVQADYNGPQSSIAFGQSYLQTANTKLTIGGTLSARKNGASSLGVTASTSDLSEVALLAGIIQSALDPSSTTQIPALAGSATLTAQASGTAKDPRVQAALSAQNVQVAGTKWRSVALNVSANSSQVAIQNGVLHGDAQEQITFSGKAGLQDWSLAPASAVQMQANITNFPIAEAQEIAQMHHPLSGMITANISLNGTRETPDGKATVTLAKASAWGQPIQNFAIDAQSHGGTIHSTVNLQVPAGTVSADATYALATQQYDVKLHADAIQLGKIDALQKRSSVQGTVQLSVTGNGTVHDPRLEADLTIPDLEAQGQKISNVAARVSLANEHATVELHSVVYQGSVEAKGDVALTGDHQANATLDVQALPIAAVAAQFLPQEGSKLAGQTEIHVTMNGPLSTPAQIEAHLQIPTLQVQYGKAQLALARPLVADYRGGTLTVNPTQIQGTGTNVTFGGTIPIRSTAAYTLTADGSMDLGVLQQFAPDVKSSGQMEIHVHSTGSASQPNMQGQFQIKNAVFTTQASPVGIEGLNAQINLSGTRADIVNLSGSAGGGTVSARGFVNFGKQSSFNLGLNAQSVRVRYPAGLRSILSGQVTLNGSTEASSLTGRVVVDSLSFTQQFDLANFAGYFSEDSSGSPTSAFENNMNLSVAVQSAQDINLASSKLSLGGSANLNVVGTLAQPVLLGRIGLSSGEVFFLSKRFAVQSGTIEFANPVRTEPVVSMYITTTVEQYNVTLNLQGPVDRLRTNYTSEPALPPADIIHLLAFGNTTEEAASQPTQSTAVGAESVLAQGVGSQVSGKLENLTGISQLTIDPLASNAAGDPGAQIAIQERVTGSLLFTFSTNVTSTQGQTVELQYDLNKRLSVTGGRDQNGGYSLELRLHKTF